MESPPNHDDDHPTVWSVVPGVQSIVYVAKSEGRPVAILEFKPGRGFLLTSCTGIEIGAFSTLADGQAGYAEWVAAEALPRSRGDRRDEVRA